MSSYQRMHDQLITLHLCDFSPLCIFTLEGGWVGGLELALDDTVSINRFGSEADTPKALSRFHARLNFSSDIQSFWSQFALQLSTAVTLILLLILDLTTLKSFVRDQGYGASDHFILLTELLSNPWCIYTVAFLFGHSWVGWEGGWVGSGCTPGWAEKTGSTR